MTGEGKVVERDALGLGRRAIRHAPSRSFHGGGWRRNGHHGVATPVSATANQTAPRRYGGHRAGYDGAGGRCFRRVARPEWHRLRVRTLWPDVAGARRLEGRRGLHLCWCLAPICPLG